MLDRNGLRPSRYWVTDDGLVVLASEVGVLDIDPATVVRKGRLKPGRMFLVDIDEHRIIEDEEIKGQLASQHPYDEWLHAGLIRLDDLADREHVVHTHASVTRRQQVFGYTEEEKRVLLAPMAKTGYEPIGSMGTDTPIAALSDRPRLLFDYFSQLFAQVTNPPLDAIREELVTSLSGTIGPEGNLLEPTPHACRQVVLPFPVIDNDELAKIRHINRDGDMPGFITHVSRGLFDVTGGGSALAARLDEICREVSAAIADGARVIVLSDRHSTAELAPIPSLLLTAAVHHHLVREKTRTQVGLIIEAGDVREVHHVALLIGYGAAAVNPYLAMESVEDLARDGHFVDVNPTVAVHNLVQGLGQGRPQGHEQDGRLDRRVVHRCPDLRGGRPLAGGRGPLLHRHHEQARRHRARHHRPGGRPPAREGLPGRRPADRAPAARGGRRVPVATRGRAAPLRPGHRVPAPARDAHRSLRRLQAVHRARRRAVGAADDAARACSASRRPRRRVARPSRSRRSSRSPRS